VDQELNDPARTDDGADDLRRLFDAIVADPRYQAGLDWGEPRPGHPEGPVRAHVEHLEQALAPLRATLAPRAWWTLRVLVHAHDAFKREAPERIPLADPRSHGALAAAWLAGLGAPPELVTMARWHDEPLALHRNARARGALDEARLDALLAAIPDWELFETFLRLDAGTAGKAPEPLAWFLATVAARRGR
jgi:hypothetical protein